MENTNYAGYARFILLTDPSVQVAVSPENIKVIEHCLQLYHQFENVPVDKTVRGVFIRNNVPWKGEQENDITINQLRPLK